MTKINSPSPYIPPNLTGLNRFIPVQTCPAKLANQRVSWKFPKISANQEQARKPMNQSESEPGASENISQLEKPAEKELNQSEFYAN